METFAARTPQTLVPIVLAAGSGQRMAPVSGGHGVPKGVVQLGDCTLLETVVRICSAAGLARPLVVTRPDPDLVRNHFAHQTLDVQWVTNPFPERGMTSSLRAGLQALESTRAESTGFLAFPVDHALVLPDDVGLLVAGFQSTECAAVLPSFGGRRGHPMLCSRAVGHEILALPDEDSPAASARTVLQRHRIHYVLMPDDRTLFDIDTPEDLAEAQRRLLNHSFSQNSG